MNNYLTPWEWKLKWSLGWHGANPVPKMLKAQSYSLGSSSEEHPCTWHWVSKLLLPCSGLSLELDYQVIISALDWHWLLDFVEPSSNGASHIAARSIAHDTSVPPNVMCKLGCVNNGGFGWRREGSKEEASGLPTNKEIRGSRYCFEKWKRFHCNYILSF